MGSQLQGEFMVEAKLEKKGRLWTLHFRPGGSTSVYPGSPDPDDDDEPAVIRSLGDEQQKFELTEPILLLHLAKRVVATLSNGSRTTESPEGPADGAVLWIEQQPFAVANTQPSSTEQ